MHVQGVDAAVARAQQRAFEKHGSDPQALPGLFDAEGGFRLAREHRAETAQLARAAQRAVDEKSVHHHADLVGGCRMARDELVRHRAGKAPLPAVVVEAEQVIAISVGLADP